MVWYMQGEVLLVPAPRFGVLHDSLDTGGVDRCLDMTLLSSALRPAVSKH